MDMQFKIIDPLEHPQWNSLIADHDDSTLFHSTHWAMVLKEAYGYTPRYITIYDRNTLHLVVPIMEVDSVITGKRGVSLPFTDYCTPIITNGIKFSELIDFLLTIGKKSGWKYFELRDCGNYLPNETASDCYYGHTLQLDSNPQNIFKNFKENTKRNIKRAIKEKVLISFEDSLESTQAFYKLNCQTRRLHGLPPQPFYFFKKIYEHILLKKKGMIILAHYKGKPIAGAIYFHFGTNALYKYGASDRQYQHLRPNNLIMWEALQYYCLSSFKEFSFGRTEQNNQGLVQFKAGWGAEISSIKYYKYNLITNNWIKKDNLNENNKFYNKLFNKLPLFCLQMIGTLVYKHLG